MLDFRGHLEEILPLTEEMLKRLEKKVTKGAQHASVDLGNALQTFFSEISPQLANGKMDQKKLAIYSKASKLFAETGKFSKTFANLWRLRKGLKSWTGWLLSKNSRVESWTTIWALHERDTYSLGNAIRQFWVCVHQHTQEPLSNFGIKCEEATPTFV